MNEPMFPFRWADYQRQQIRHPSGAFAHLQPQEADVLFVLAVHYPRPVYGGTMIDALWGDDPDGGPNDAFGVVSVRICALNKKLPEGWRIVSRHLRLSIEPTRGDGA